MKIKTTLYAGDVTPELLAHSKKVYCATRIGCVDDHYFTTKKELLQFARPLGDYCVSRLVYNPKTEEYDADFEIV